MKVKTLDLFTDKLTTGASEIVEPNNINRSFHLHGLVSASTGAASVTVEGSNDGVNFVTLDTLALTLGTARTHDYFVVSAAWRYNRATVASISGTDASITLTMGCEAA